MSGVSRASIEHRFWSKVKRTESCWLWTGAVSPTDGYARFRAGSQGVRLAHRISYQMTNGSVPAGLVLDHLCRVRHCVRPDHLEAVTLRENTLRGMHPSAIRARSDRCAKGHSFDEENTILSPEGWRKCRTCRHAREAARWAARKSARAVSA